MSDPSEPHPARVGSVVAFAPSEGQTITLVPPAAEGTYTFAFSDAFAPGAEQTIILTPVPGLAPPEAAGAYTFSFSEVPVPGELEPQAVLLGTVVTGSPLVKV
jgi:hypothetical protein